MGPISYSKDHGPDLRQMIVRYWSRRRATGMLRNAAGAKSTTDPGNRSAAHFAIVCVVADCGTISAETVAELEAWQLLYILGVRKRGEAGAELVLDDAALANSTSSTISRASLTTSSFAEAVDSRPSISSLNFHACAAKQVVSSAWGAHLLGLPSPFVDSHAKMHPLNSQFVSGLLLCVRHIGRMRTRICPREGCVSYPPQVGSRSAL